jgi:hypothetical protein
MNWILIGFAALPLLGALGLLWYRARVGGERTLMASTPTSKAAEVARLAPGTIVEVKGNLRCQSPLKAEFSQETCAWFLAKIDREEVYYERDSQGRNERKTRTTTLHSNTRFAPCLVEDQSGVVALNIEGADVEGEQVVHRRENEDRGMTGVIVSLATGGGSADLIRTESILRLDIPIYVLGEVQADRSIGKPAPNSRNKTFVVSRKSEEQRTKDLGSTMMWLMVGAVVLAIIAAAMVFWGARNP